MKKFTWITSSCLLLTLIVFYTVQLYGSDEAAKETQSSQEGRTSDKEKNKKQLPSVGIETIQVASLSKTIDLTGSVVPTRTAKIASPGEGPVKACVTLKCMVREGDLVKKGQILLEIGRNKTAQSQLSASRQALKEQELELQRVEKLVQAGAIPGSELDTARSKCENARAQLAKATESSDDYSVSAPWQGIVAKVHVTEGDYVAPRTPLIEIFDPNSLVIQFAVPEARSTNVRNDMPIRVHLDAHPGMTFQGKINRIYPQLDLRTRTRLVEATLSDKIDLLPGMFARIEVLLEQVPEALTVATEAVLVNPKGEQVAFVLQGEKVVRRKIQTGIEEAGRVQIIAGIHPGEQVVIAGNEKIKDGDQVRLRKGAQL